MALRLIDETGIAVTLDAAAYEFPHSNDWWDGNWLRIKGTVQHPQGNWSFLDPCLTSFEVAQLARWLLSLRPDSPAKPCFFTEPCLTFRFSLTPAPSIELSLSHEAAPPWLANEEATEDFTMSFPLLLNTSDQLAEAAQEMLRRFPVRGKRG